MTKKSVSATIIKAAKEEFQKRKYNETSIDDIINSAGVTRSDFENCFATKDECCKKVLKSYEADLKSTFAELEENGNTRQRLSIYLDTFSENAEIIAQDGDAIQNLYHDVRNLEAGLSSAAENLLKIQHKWIDEQFVIMLKTESGVNQGDRLTAALYGLLMLTKLTNNSAMLKNQLIQLKSWIRTM